MEKLIKRFEVWDLYEKDFLITKRKKNMGTYEKVEINVEIPEFKVSVSSYSESSKIDNLKRCFDILEVILNNYML